MSSWKQYQEGFISEFVEKERITQIYYTLVGVRMGQILKQVSKISGIYGQPGEERVSSFLAENLPDRYVILNSPRLSYHGATFDIDHVVIGPNGVFVIETKNMQGTVLGGIMGNWVQERNRSGRNRKVKIGNPANQVNQYGKVVKSHLGSRLAYMTGRKINFRIYPVVVFVHEEIDLSKMEYTKPGYIGRVKVLTLFGLVDFILAREGANYTDNDIAQFADLLVPADQRDQTGYYSPGQLKELIGNKEGRYEIFEEIGRGNFGIVYRAFDYKLDQEVAIKKLPLHHQISPNIVQRFYREAQIASSLNHENIVRVHDYYEESGEYFMVMEMVDGQTLEQYVRDQPMSIAEALRVITEIGKALDYAHNNQVVHRDLKPSNIMISVDGTVKVADFGIAKLTTATDLTLDGSNAGTPMTMSPEQVTGQPVTPKSDIFSTGVLLYYLVTGKMPFEGEHLGEIVHKITYLAPVDPQKLNFEVSPELQFVILQALQKNPADRFESMALFMQAVDDVAHSRGLSVKGRMKTGQHLPSLIKHIWRTPKSIFSTITILSLVIFVGILGFQVYRDSRQLSQQVILTKQYGFNNDNLPMLISNPKLYIGLPVNLVGRIDKTTNLDNQNTQFNLTVNSNDQKGYQNVIVKYTGPMDSLQNASYVKITGSLQNTVKTAENEQTPYIIADKVEPIEDPWSILAPSLFTVYPGKTVNQNGRIVRIEKVEFAESETRLFITVKNSESANDIFLLANPVAKQGNRIFRELSGSYRIPLDQALRLQPLQEAREVVFLEPVDRSKTSATFILGSSNDLLMGQQPYTFDITW